MKMNVKKKIYSLWMSLLMLFAMIGNLLFPFYVQAAEGEKMIVDTSGTGYLAVKNTLDMAATWESNGLYAQTAPTLANPESVLYNVARMSSSDGSPAFCLQKNAEAPAGSYQAGNSDISAAALETAAKIAANSVLLFAKDSNGNYSMNCLPSQYSNLTYDEVYYAAQLAIWIKMALPNGLSGVQTTSKLISDNGTNQVYRYESTNAEKGNELVWYYNTDDYVDMSASDCTSAWYLIANYNLMYNYGVSEDVKGFCDYLIAGNFSDATASCSIGSVIEEGDYYKFSVTANTTLAGGGSSLTLSGMPANSYVVDSMGKKVLMENASIDINGNADAVYTVYVPVSSCLTSQEITAKVTANQYGTDNTAVLVVNQSSEQDVLTTTRVSGSSAATASDSITLVTDTVDFPVKKVWDDNNNQDGIRPDSVTIHLYADGIDTGKSVTLNEENGWSHVFTNLQKTSRGKEIIYSVQEEEVAGYTTSINGNVIVNLHQAETTEFTVNKIWNDADNRDGKRVSSVTIHLYGNEKEIDTATLSAENGWTYTFTDLPKYSEGKKIVYTVLEDAVTDYETSIEGGTITNSHNPEMVDIPVTKIWNDENHVELRPESVTIHLYQNGEEIDKVELSEENSWTHTFSELSKYDGGNLISYSISEDLVDGYSTEIEEGNGYSVINTLNGGRIQIEKQSENGAILSDVVFEIYSDAECGILVDSITTDKDGYAISKKLPYGTYYVKEISTETGYVLSDEVYEVKTGWTIDVATLPVMNETIKVEFSKLSVTGDCPEVSGAELQILDSEGNIITHFISGIEPTILEGQLVPGTYILREIRAPFGYKVAEDVTFTVTNTGEIQKVTMVDSEIYGSLVINKTDAKTGEPLADASFELHYARDVLDVNGMIIHREGEIAVDKNGNEVCLNTDEKGLAEWSDIPVGTYNANGWNEYIDYVLVETKTPEGYIAGEKDIELTFESELEAVNGNEDVKKVLSVSNMKKEEPDQPTAPNTGDSMNVAFVMVILSVSMLLFAILACRRKHKKW